jgi:tryptophanyl-tRNA synthetase
MSLTDGTKKMSKSDPSDYSRITLTDDADAIANKIKKAQTDSDPSLTFDEENRPSVANLLTIYAALSGSTPQQVAEKFSALKTGQFKAQLAELAVAKLAPITARMRELMDDTAMLDGILREGAEKARAVAAPIMAETMKRVGFLQV